MAGRGEELGYTKPELLHVFQQYLNLLRAAHG